MLPEWLKWELLLKPFRKKHCDFAKTWGKTHLEAFMEIRKGMSYLILTKWQQLTLKIQADLWKCLSTQVVMDGVEF